MIDPRYTIHAIVYDCLNAAIVRDSDFVESADLTDVFGDYDTAAESAADTDTGG